jgi:ABC-type transport system substrate-binding protein
LIFIRFDSWRRSRRDNKERRTRCEAGENRSRGKAGGTDQATWWGKLSKGTTDFTLILPSLQPDADFPMMRYYHSSAFSPGMNVSRYDKIDDLIEKARMEKNEKSRLDLYHTIQKRMMEDVPSIPLMMMIYPVPYKGYLAGIAERDYVWGLDFYLFHFVGKK